MGNPAGEGVETRQTRSATRGDERRERDGVITSANGNEHVKDGRAVRKSLDADDNKWRARMSRSLSCDRTEFAQMSMEAEAEKKSAGGDHILVVLLTFGTLAAISYYTMPATWVCLPAWACPSPLATMCHTGCAQRNHQTVASPTKPPSLPSKRLHKLTHERNLLCVQAFDQGADSAARVVLRVVVGSLNGARIHTSPLLEQSEQQVAWRFQRYRGRDDVQRVIQSRG